MQQEGKVVQEHEQDFSEPWEQSDVVLLVEGQKIYVHRLMLSMCSPVFSRMFSAEFGEVASCLGNHIRHAMQMNSRFQDFAMTTEQYIC